MPAVIYTNIITLAMITLATIVAVLFISHKIAGPMLRFEEELKRIGKGDLTKKIKLRKKDQFEDMAESLIEMTANLHRKISAIQKKMDKILKTASRQKTPAKLIKELDNLNQYINSQFKM
jgi:methyl-accepting chemotaxis protein